jgi:hypothetical protein
LSAAKPILHFIFLGEQQHSNREGFPAYVADRLSAVKWRNWKVHFIWQENMYNPPVTLPLPKVINLLTDLKEERDGAVWHNSWVVAPVTKIVDEFFLQLKSSCLKMCACPAAQVANARQVRIPPRQQKPNQSVSEVIDLVIESIQRYTYPIIPNDLSPC